MEVFLLFLSLGYGADLGRSRLVFRHSETFPFFRFCENFSRKFYNVSKGSLLHFFDVIFIYSSPTDACTMDQQQSVDRSVTLAHPAAAGSGTSAPPAKEKKKRGRFLSFMSKKSKTFGGNNVQNTTTSLQQDFADIPFVCEAPAQQKIKSEAKIVELNREIDKLEKERDGMLRLKTSYLTNTAYGDAKSLEPKISRVGQELDSKRIELKRYSEFLAAVKCSNSATCAASVGSSQSSKSNRDSHRYSRDYQPDSNYGESSNCYSG